MKMTTLRFSHPEIKKLSFRQRGIHNVADHVIVGCEDLNHLELQDAQSLLFKAAGMISLREDRKKAAEKVIQALGLHNLAIIQAGAHIRLRYCSLGEYSAHFRQR